MATFMIVEQEGFAPKVGILASQLQNTRVYLHSVVRELTNEALDAKPEHGANSIAQILAHISAAERFFHAMVFADRQFDEEERARWWASFRFEDCEWNQGRALTDYLDDLKAGRDETLKQLGTKDDAWLEEPKSFFGQPANRHYYWFHFLQDEVRHTGQIILLRKYLIGSSDESFNPYAF